MPDGTGAPGDFTDFGRSSLQVLLAEVPQVARSGEAARVGNLLEGHVRVRQQGDHVHLPFPSAQESRCITASDAEPEEMFSHF